MLSLGCRKAHQRPVGGFKSMLDLPEDVLILISSQCRTDELFTLRLTCVKTCTLVDKYIATIAPSVARSTFPQSDHLLARYGATRYTLQSLKALIPEHLAAVLVDRHRIADEWLQWHYGIPAEDAFGDELRDRVASGWRVLWNLSKISRVEYDMHAKGTRMSPGDFANKMFRPNHFKLEALKHIEDTILHNRMGYVARLEPKQAQDYKLMFALLSFAFSTSISNLGDEHVPWPFDFGGGIDGQRALRKGESWLLWYILAEGPDLFWRQWWSLPRDATTTPSYIRDGAIKAFAMTPTKLSDHQRSLAGTFQEAISQRALLTGAFGESNPVRFFARYAEHRMSRKEAGLPPAREILQDVPFLVKFRCPEEVVKRHQAVVEERELSRASQPWPRG
ncbi:hypothetical protein ACEQ8H_002697 [Pleosporales sp. CAS-2024a]